MSLAAPAFLAVLLIVPLGFAAHLYARRHRRRFAVRFPAAATVAAVSARTSAWRRRVAPLLLALAAATLALALARPHRTVAVPIERASVVLVLDTSRSMLADDVAPTRLEAAKAAARRFLDRVPDSLRVGLVAYSTVPHTFIDPTQRREELRYTIEALVPDGGTATGDALRAALDRARRPAGEDGRRPPTAIVLLSDGKSTDGQNPVAVARDAGRADVPVYTVALGTPQGTVDGGPFQPRIPVPPDPATLREMARVSGGQSFAVEDARELDRVYRRLGSRVGERNERREITSAFAGAGLVLLLGAAAAAARWRPRVP